MAAARAARHLLVRRGRVHLRRVRRGRLAGATHVHVLCRLRLRLLHGCLLPPLLLPQIAGLVPSDLGDFCGEAAGIIEHFCDVAGGSDVEFVVYVEGVRLTELLEKGECGDVESHHLSEETQGKHAIEFFEASGGASDRFSRLVLGSELAM